MSTVFIITDPCYCIHDNQEWQNILNATGCFGADDNLPFKANKDVTFHAYQTTEHGDGSITLPEGEIAVDSGTLCVAEISLEEYQRNHQKFGIVFNSLLEAIANFSVIMDAFNGGEDDYDEELMDMYEKEELVEEDCD